MIDDQAPNASAPGGNNEVGYGKPPSHTRFKKGQSGNPRGAPKPMSTVDAAAAILARPMTIKIKGKRRRVTTQEALLLAQLQAGMGGDNKAAKLMLELAQKAPPPPPEVTAEEQHLEMQEAMDGISEEHLEAMSLFHRRPSEIQQRRKRR